MEGKLRNCDRRKLLENEKEISKQVDIKYLIPRLLKIICVKDAERLCDDTTSNEDCVSYLIHDLLKNGTYTDLKMVHVELIKSRQGDACQLFPSYDQEFDEEFEGDVNGEEDCESNGEDNSDSEIWVDENGKQVDMVADAGGLMCITRKGLKKVKSIAKNVLNSPTGLDQNDGVNVKNTPVKKKTQQSEAKFTDAFVKYPTKPNHGSYGKGVCVIFPLFTGHLKGYLRDVDNLKGFFGDVLQYDIMTDKSYNNLTRQQLLDKVEEVCKHIEDKGYYDRLFVVLLSHGTADGILTCADKQGWAKEMKEQGAEKEKVLVKTEIEEIVNKFKHNNLPSLKGMPKVFLVQACRGPEKDMVTAASPTSAAKGVKLITDDCLPYEAKCPVDGDIMICYATTMDHPSLVAVNNGSWFIQDLLEVFEKHHSKEHVADMMTVVHLAISERRSSLKLEDHQNIEALQMPCTLTSLRKRFYLKT